jgi:hypothetical protein
VPQATVTGQSVLVQATLTGTGVSGGVPVQFARSGGTLSAQSAVTAGDGTASTLLTDWTAETDTVTATASVAGSTLSASVDVPFVTAPSVPTTTASTVSGDLPSLATPTDLTGAVSGSSVDLGSASLPGLDVTLDAGSVAAAASVAGSVSATVASTASALQLLAGTPALAVVGTSPSAPTSGVFVGPVVQFSLSGTAAQMFGEDSATQDTGALVVTMPYDAAAVPSGGTPEVVWLNPSGQWTNAGVVVLGWGGGFVTALLPHLSTYTVVALQGSVAASESLTVSASTAPVGASVTVTALVTDQAGAPLAGEPVGFATTLGSLASTTAVTNESGQAVTTLSSGQVGTAMVSAAVSGISPASAAQVRFSAVATGPAVTGISPTGGPASGGTQVTITGTGFTSPATVDFGPNAATNVTVQSPTQIVATAPAGSGAVDVTVTTSTGESAAVQFTYTAVSVAPQVALLPTVVGISPTSGPASGGTGVTITGTDFTSPARVHFGPNGATDVAVESPTQIVATAPAGGGTVDVTVTTSTGTSPTSAADQFTYTAASVPSQVMTFSDVPSSFWAYSDIETLAARGIINGFPDGTFQPNADVTRAQFVKMLVLTVGLTPGGGTAPFTDTPPSAWYAPFVSAAVQAGIVHGLSPTTFGPNATVTREQMAVMVARALKLTKTATLHFRDDATIDPWALQGVEEAVAAGDIHGFPNGTFQPLGPTTRAQAATVLAEWLSGKAASTGGGNGS